MRAILNNDLIVKLAFADGTEIGDLPSGVGLERLRFDGSAVVDLATLSEIWVRTSTSGALELHCIDIGGCQLVTMTYNQRDLLINDAGTYRLKTVAELDAEQLAELLSRAKVKLSSRIKKELGGLEEFQLHTLAFVVALIVYARNQPPALGAFFDNLIPHIQAMFPMNRWENVLTNSAQKLKAIIEQYNEDTDIGADP